jgi:hypothetical protein
MFVVFLQSDSEYRMNLVQEKKKEEGQSVWPRGTIHDTHRFQ